MMRRYGLIAAILLALALRLAAALVLQNPVEDDALSYFTMAEGLVTRGEWRDVWGQHAFFSAGYPLLLAAFFAPLGASVATVLTVNLLLAAASAWLLHRITLAICAREEAALVAVLAYALWLPGIWNATMVAKENLSTTLLLAVAYGALRIARDRRPLQAAILAGLAWGAGIVTGGSSLLLCAGVATALLYLIFLRRSFRPALIAGATFTLAAALMVAPWLYATKAMVGRPILTTNAAFNLYLGHNPAATGRFVSIAQTPLGEGWQQRRVELGEVGLSDLLHAQATRWIADNPGATATLALRKLAYFWEPNLPDAADSGSSLVRALRWVEVVQYLAILLLAVWALASSRIAPRDKLVPGAMVAGFWVIHALAYIIPRYRDPAMPLLIALGAVPITLWLLDRSGTRRLTHVA